MKNLYIKIMTLKLNALICRYKSVILIYENEQLLYGNFYKETLDYSYRKVHLRWLNFKIKVVIALLY